jgi:cell division control protein 24
VESPGILPRKADWVPQEKSFSVYEPYAANFNSALELAQAEAEKLAQMPHPVYDQLQAFLIKPVQRITKYPLLLKDLVKHSDPIAVEDQQLEAGLEAIQRIATATNEAIRKSENMEIVKDLEGRVEDWKGHKLEHFGELLLHGQFSVIKGDQRGDVEREVTYMHMLQQQVGLADRQMQYYIYLFERILLCCKEMGANKKQGKTMSMAKGSKGVPPKKKNTTLQLKGRIFMQNVTDVISLARNGRQQQRNVLVRSQAYRIQVHTHFRSSGEAIQASRTS